MLVTILISLKNKWPLKNPFAITQCIILRVLQEPISLPFDCRGDGARLPIGYGVSDDAELQCMN